MKKTYFNINSTEIIWASPKCDGFQKNKHDSAVFTYLLTVGFSFVDTKFKAHSNTGSWDVWTAEREIVFSLSLQHRPSTACRKLGENQVDVQKGKLRANHESTNTQRYKIWVTKSLIDVATQYIVEKQEREECLYFLD